MNLTNEIYRYPRKIEKELENIRVQTRKEDAEIILKYYATRVAQRISQARIFKCLYNMKIISKMSAKPLVELTKDDIIEIVGKIEQRNISDYTKRDYRVVLKQFFQWLKGYDPGEYPAEVRWLREGRRPQSRIQKKDLLTPDELKRLAEAAHNLRDRALILVLIESKRRLGEIMALRIKDVEFDNLGARLRVEGKVGVDNSRVIACAPVLANWINLHPLRDNPDAPLWVTQDKNDDFRVMAYQTVRYMLVGCAKRAGIQKRFWPYLTRHSVLTPAAKVLSYSLLCAVAGWKQGSRMPGVYIKLAGEDIDQAHMMLNGIQKTETPDKSEPRKCSKCNCLNSIDSKFCNKCGLPLDAATLIQMDAARDKADELLKKLMQNPEKLEKLLALIDAS